MKKVLIITYYWPPAGGPGVQRVLKFAKYLPEFGWQPIILTVKKPTSPARDESLVASIPSDAIVYKTRSIEPFGVYKNLPGKSLLILFLRILLLKRRMNHIGRNCPAGSVQTYLFPMLESVGFLFLF